jgi:hypothetical protein
LYERWLQAELQNNLAHTFTYFVNLGFWQLIVLKVQYFSKLMRCICLWRHYAHARAVWCSWCTLEWLGYPCALVIARAIKGRERICVTSCYLTTKIPSAPLVVVVRLQHTRYPRFRRGTFGYGITLPPIERGRAGGTEFSCGCTLVYPCFPNAYSMQCMLKSNIYFNSPSREQDQRNKLRIDESIGSLIDTKFLEHRTWWITTSISNTDKDHYGKRCLIKALHQWGFSRITKQHLELQCRLAAQQGS